MGLPSPFLFRDWDVTGACGPIGARYKKEVADKMDIVILAPTISRARQVNLRTKRNVKAPADLAGVKFRMPGGWWLLLGQSHRRRRRPDGHAEVYLALKTGSIDGQENPLTIMSAAKYFEVTEQVVLTGHLVQPDHCCASRSGTASPTTSRAR